MRRPYVVMQLHGSFPSLLNWSQTIIVHLQLKASSMKPQLFCLCHLFMFVRYFVQLGFECCYKWRLYKLSEQPFPVFGCSCSNMVFLFFVFLCLNGFIFFSFQFNLTVFRHFLQLLYLRNHAIYLRLHPAFSSECVLLN